ncbi:MAG TPA: 2-C-methyl-D-erythritol 4-phosphate cytidylyltransferase [Jatrophihabitantaceae bacterium]|jgi:2-C-methyl-D-erythritol 4-phosphate cytidylyltransferase
MAANDQLIVAAIVVAAGSGARLGADVPKAFVRVGTRTLLEHAAGRLAAHPRVATVVIAAPGEYVEQARTLVPDAVVVAGGRTRQQSVARALAAVPADVDLVLVHDAARAFVPVEVVGRVIAALDAGAEGVVPTLPVSDTIRTVEPESGELGDLVDRSRLLAMQTPQGFRRDVLAKAHAAGADEAATDDAALVEALGRRVVAVRGDERAFKVTVPLDLAIAEALLDD